MRNPLAGRTPLAVAALAAGGILASVGAASAAPPTEPIEPTGGVDLDQLTEVLTPEQITCIGTQSTPEMAEDPAAAIEVLTECGVSMEDLVALVPGGDVADVADPVASSEVAVGDGSVDAAAVAAVLAAAGLDATDLTCIADGLGAAVAGDDAEALVILQECGVSLADVLQGLVTVGADAPVAAADVPASSDDPASPSSDASAPSAGTGDPVNDMVTGMLTSMGIDLSPDQITCLTEAVSGAGVDTADTGALMALLSECGISLTDMMPSG